MAGSTLQGPGILNGTVHPGRKMIFQTSMIMFHVNLPGCNSSFCRFAPGLVFVVFLPSKNKVPPWSLLPSLQSWAFSHGNWPTQDVGGENMKKPP